MNLLCSKGLTPLSGRGDNYPDIGGAGDGPQCPDRLRPLPCSETCQHGGRRGAQRDHAGTRWHRRGKVHQVLSLGLAEKPMEPHPRATSEVERGTEGEQTTVSRLSSQGGFGPGARLPPAQASPKGLAGLARLGFSFQARPVCQTCSNRTSAQRRHHGVSTGDFSEALEAILGPNAAGLSSTNIARLKGEWKKDLEAWSKRDLSGKKYVYWWLTGSTSTCASTRIALACLCSLGLILYKRVPLSPRCARNIAEFR